MPGITPKEGSVVMANMIYPQTEPNRGTDLEVMLFVAPSTVDEDTVLADLTELTGANYSRITLADASWTVGSDGTVTFAEQTFTPTGGSWSDIYGYAVVTKGSTPKILHIEKGPQAPYDVAEDQPFRVIPKIRLGAASTGS